ncbi:MAG: sigma-70 family RNA polymerase sigma factor [Anaerolineaceae bacterium]|nr:sigma-70 family RNA polymerase sigma factor [Anaerolineaceae bacterium]
MAKQPAIMDEGDYIKLARNGDQEAFTRIVETYQNPVYNFCYRMLGTPQAAEDAAQESFWRAYKNLHRYDIKRPFATWLLSIAAHYCIDQQRRKRLPTMDLNEIIEFTAEDPAPNPEISTMDMEFTEIVQRQLAHLSANDRAVLILRYWHEYSEDEISQTLSISKSAVKSRLHRARKHMAAQWEKAQNSLRIERRHHETQTI